MKPNCAQPSNRCRKYSAFQTGEQNKIPDMQGSNKLSEMGDTEKRVHVTVKLTINIINS